MSFSPDGLHWKEHDSNPVWHVPSDINDVMLYERRGHFVAFFKVWELTGRELPKDGPADGVPFTAYMPFFTPKHMTNGSTQFDGPSITFHPLAAATVSNKPFVLRSGNQSADDGGGTSLSGEWRAKRVQCFAESEDGIHWTNEQVVMRADEKDPPTANIQFLFVIPYGGYYLGFPTLHDESGHFRIQLAWSADGLHWKRPWREPWLDVGSNGSFDSGMVLGPADPIIRDKEMWFPYGGFPILHNSTATSWEAAIGLATTRLDGFSAWEAGDKIGILITEPFELRGDRIFLNAEADKGEIRVEVMDPNQLALAGFSSEGCEPISTDTLVDKQAGWVHWKGADLSSLGHKGIQLRFLMRNARLYSYRIADAATMDLAVPRATDR